jgi:hypothetical protein
MNALIRAKLSYDGVEHRLREEQVVIAQMNRRDDFLTSKSHYHREVGRMTKHRGKDGQKSMEMLCEYLLYAYKKSVAPHKLRSIHPSIPSMTWTPTPQHGIVLRSIE